MSWENPKQDLKGSYRSKLNINDMMGQVKTLKGQQSLSGIVKNQGLDLATQVLRFSKTNSLRITPKKNGMMANVKTLKGKQTLNGIVKNQGFDLTSQILRFSKTNNIRVAPKTIMVDRTMKGGYASKLNMNNMMGQ